MIAGFREEVRAGAVFNHDGIKPVWFDLHGHKVAIKEIHYKWTEKYSGSTIYKFTVSDGENFYELHFSGDDMRWYLAAMG